MDLSWLVRSIREVRLWGHWGVWAPITTLILVFAGIHPTVILQLVTYVPQVTLRAFRGIRSTILDLSSVRSANLLYRSSLEPYCRFVQSREERDIDEVVSLRRRAVDLLRETHSYRPVLLDQLGSALHDRFTVFGDMPDINDAISIRRLLAPHLPDDHFGKPVALGNLASSLFARFERLDEMEDLEESITNYRRAVELVPSDHPFRPAYLNGFGRSLQHRFERLRELSDLEAAIQIHRLTLQLIPDGRPEKRTALYALGVCLRTRSDQAGDRADFDESVQIYRHILRLTADGDTDKPTWLHSLGGCLQDRYRRHGDLRDLEESIGCQRSAVAISHGDRRNPFWLRGLSSCLQARYERLGEIEDLDDAIHLQRLVVDLVPDGHPEKPLQLATLGDALRLRYRRLWKPEDIEQTLSIQKTCIELTPNESKERSLRLGNLAVSYLDRFQHLRELDDLERAISTQLLANDLTPYSPFEKLAGNMNLGNFLSYRFEALGHIEDIERAIEEQKSTLEILPHEHPDYPKGTHNLASSYQARFERDKTQANFDVAVTWFLNATASALGNPFMRLTSAEQCIKLLEINTHFSSPGTVLSAYERIFDLLPEIVWLGYSLSRRYYETAKLGRLVSGAVAAAIGSNALPVAVEWLEAGRSLVWSQILSLRVPFDELEVEHPRLAAELREISLKLQLSGHISRFYNPNMSREPGSANEAADSHRELVIRYDRALVEVRRSPGFESFLRPPKLSTFASALNRADGPVVFINMYQASCHAVALLPHSGPVHIALPEMTEDRAFQLRKLWRQALDRHNVRVRATALVDPDNADDPRRVLTHLWTWVVRPVLQRLQLMALPSNTKRLPHITWCPTGSLTQLPMHAAGQYDVAVEHAGQRVFDFVVSSYTPSLTSFIRCHQGRARRSRSLPKTLVITQPATPTLSALPGTVDECNRLRTILPKNTYTALEDKEAIIKDTMVEMKRHSWVHLACHGRQNTLDPTQSAFALYDGPLTLSSLMGTVADDAELAFLSACQTAVGDEKVPEESVHLAAGMLAVGFIGVVATMWSIGDREAPIVVDAYYKELLELRSLEGDGLQGTGAARALHEAVGVLRRQVGEDNIVKWAPFAHFGI